ncbi:MAG: putative DNA binding domain-containing protein [Candidatus Izemoplasmatales bacterium]|jgi:predicted HTH transcriptional regulator|nr:putative DNA binding domain-containing protein [Candidatus Izemoplasmatales bacterium]
MDIIESNKIELKSKYTDQLIREIVAFINAEGGKVYIGIEDNGNVVGATNIDEALRNIADIITTQIEPNAIDIVTPEIQVMDGKPVIVVNIKKGIAPIYCIKRYGFSSVGCPIRIGSSCREMSEAQINERYKQRFFDEDLLISSPTNPPTLSFTTLKNYYLEQGYKLNDDTFESNLKLINSNGKYNVMAELLSDNNRFSLIFVKFAGLNKASISQRSDYGNKSILFGYSQLMNRIQAENICKTDTSVRPRIDTYLYDYNCVNEAIVNAIVHNDWSITEPQISFYNNRIEILSHGGLPYGLTEEQFYMGFSKPRNVQLMKIFSLLNIVDHTGHGIPIIINKYGKEAFDIRDNYIMVTIPFEKDVVATMNVGVSVDVNEIEKIILEGLLKDPTLNAYKLSLLIDKSKRTVERYLKSLQERGYITRKGADKNGYWRVLK